MKEMIFRAGRTFVQAAVGYVAANLVVTFSGMTPTTAADWKTAIVTLITAAVAAGLAAVMNAPKKPVDNEPVFDEKLITPVTSEDIEEEADDFDEEEDEPEEETE